MIFYQARKRHININFFVRWSQFFTGFVPGTNPVCPWDKSGEKLGQTQEFSYSTKWKPDFTGFVPGTNPGLSLGQSRGRRAAQKVYVKKVYVPFSLAILNDLGPYFYLLGDPKKIFSWFRRRTHKLFCPVSRPVVAGSTGPWPEQKVYVYVFYSLPQVRGGQFRAKSRRKTTGRQFFRAGFRQNGFFADFYFWAAGFFRGFSRRIFLLIFVGKSAQKNPPGKSPANPPKFTQQKSSNTFLQIGKGKILAARHLDLRHRRPPTGVSRARVSPGVFPKNRGVQQSVRVGVCWPPPPLPGPQTLRRTAWCSGTPREKRVYILGCF